MTTQPRREAVAKSEDGEGATMIDEDGVVLACDILMMIC